MRHTLLLVILVLLALHMPASPVHAGGVVTVCDEAHLLAALAGGGTVTFSCSGTITLTAEIVIAVDTTIDGSGQSVTISGNHAVRVFSVNEGIAFNLNELTLANGIATFYGGGGILNNKGTVSVRNSTFSGNSATSGGGIDNIRGGTLTVSNSTFSHNSATEYGGGGISNSFDGTVTVSYSTFSANTANNTNYGGGGIFNFYDGAVTVRNSTFSANSADMGGGILNAGTLGVSNSTFSNNVAPDYGGGGIGSNQGVVTVSNSTLFGNSAAEYGGGIYNNNGTMTVSNTTFSNNSASRNGGSIYFSSGTVTLKNAIVASSPAGGNCDGSFPFIDGGGNLSYPDTTCPGINADPKLGPLQNNGGPTWTMALLPGSAAIDAGIDAICAAAPVNGLDQRGFTRPLGAHCDIGAYERHAFGFWFPLASAR